MENPPSTLGQQIHARRARLGLDQRALVNKAGVSKDVINKLERGGQQDTVSKNALDIARALECTVEALHSKSGEDSQLPEHLPLPEERLGEIIAEAAEDVLTFIREEKFDDDPHTVAQQIAEVFAQKAEIERLRARPVTVKLGGNVIALPLRRQTA